MENTVISNFWGAVIASIIIVSSALLLETHDHVGKVLVMEGALFGIRLGNQAMKSYHLGKSDPTKLKC